VSHVVLASIEDSNLIPTEEGVEGSAKHCGDEVRQAVLARLRLGGQRLVVWSGVAHYLI
jgi:hypothetical protein